MNVGDNRNLTLAEVAQCIMNSNLDIPTGGGYVITPIKDGGELGNDAIIKITRVK